MKAAPLVREKANRDVLKRVIFDNLRVIFEVCEDKDFVTASVEKSIDKWPCLVEVLILLLHHTSIIVSIFLVIFLSFFSILKQIQIYEPRGLSG